MSLVPSRAARIVAWALLPALLAVAMPATGRASISVEIATEAMIADIQTNNLYLASLLGGAPTIQLSYTSNVDPTGLAFSYTLDPGTSYQGQALSLTASGSFDTSSQTWSSAMSGALGPTPFSGQGVGDLKKNPDGTYTETLDGDEYEEKDGKKVKTGDKHLQVDFDLKNGTSTSKGWRTDAKGDKVPKSDQNGNDRLNKDTKKWEDVAWAVDPTGPFPVVIASSGTWAEEGGSGRFTTSITPIPEPATLVSGLIGTTCAALLALRRRAAGGGGPRA